MDIVIEPRKSAFRMRIQSFAFVNKIYKDEISFFDACASPFISTIEEILHNFFFVKIHTNFRAEFVKCYPNSKREMNRVEVYFQSRAEKISNETRLDHFYQKHTRFPQ